MNLCGGLEVTVIGIRHKETIVLHDAISLLTSLLLLRLRSAASVFEIFESRAISNGQTAAFISVDSDIFADPICSALQVGAAEIEIFCTSPPGDGSTLLYIT